MPHYRANTTISILSAEPDTDEWGDPIDSDSVSVSGVPASLTETGTSAYSENTTKPRVIRNGILRLSTYYADQITDNNRIKDERTGDTWIILSVTSPNNAIGHVPMHIELQKVS